MNTRNPSYIFNPNAAAWFFVISLVSYNSSCRERPFLTRNPGNGKKRPEQS